MLFGICCKFTINSELVVLCIRNLLQIYNKFRIGVALYSEFTANGVVSKRLGLIVWSNSFDVMEAEKVAGVLNNKSGDGIRAYGFRIIILRGNVKMEFFNINALLLKNQISLTIIHNKSCILAARVTEY